MNAGPLLYGSGFTLAELIGHYEALVEIDLESLPCADALRAQIIEAMRGTEFDEHAYTHADAGLLAQQPKPEPLGDAQGGTQEAPELWPYGAVPTAPPWQS